jgi:hypothetical protein
MFVAIRRPSSLVSSFSRRSSARLILVIDIRELLSAVIAHDKAERPIPRQTKVGEAKLVSTFAKYRSQERVALLVCADDENN